MAKSRIHPQFFQTLVPGFHTQLTIPEDFFSKYVEGRSVAELKSDESDITWKVNLTGQRLTDGWEEFVVDNDFQIGDVVVVRYVGDNVFHVLDLGPNYSEIQDNEGKHLSKKRLHSRTHSRTQVEVSSNDGDVDDDEEDNIELPRKKKAKNIQETEPVSSSSSSDNSCFMALVTASSLRTDTLYLPLHFTSSNGFTRKCSEILLTDGGERSWALDLRFDESSGTFYITRGWRKFCDENGQKARRCFMFKLVGNRETPVLSLCSTEVVSDRRPRDCSEASRRESVATKHSSEEENIAGEGSKDECSSLMETEKKKNGPKRNLPYSSYSPCHKRFVTFTLPPDYVRIDTLCLPKAFLRKNDIKPGEMYLLDKDGTKWLTKLIQDTKGIMKMRHGWKEFVKAIDLTSFTLKLIWEDTTPVLSLCGAESTSDREKEEFSKDIENDKEESQKQFVTFTITPYGLKKCRLILSGPFARENGINKPGTIYLLDTNGTKWLTNLQQDKKGTLSLGKGWKEFAEANDLKSGQSFTMELVWEDKTPVLRLLHTEFSSSEANEKESVSSEPRSRDSSPTIENRFVTLPLTHEDVKAGILILPSQFLKANGINKLGKITLLGENGMEWLGYMLSRDGFVALGNGWEGFCEANGVKLGESFTLEFIDEQDTTPVLKFSSLETK